MTLTKKIVLNILITFSALYLVGGGWFAYHNIVMERRVMICNSLPASLRMELSQNGIAEESMPAGEYTVLMGGEVSPDCHPRTPAWSMEEMSHAVMYTLLWLPMIAGKLLG